MTEPLTALRSVDPTPSNSADCHLMRSDYPHAEGVPTPIDFVHEACAGLSQKQISQIMYENGRRMLPAGPNAASY